MATLHVIYRIAADIEELQRHLDEGAKHIARVERAAQRLGTRLKKRERARRRKAAKAARS